MIYASIFGLICFCGLSVAGKSKYRTISNYQMPNGHPECHYCKSPNVRTVLFKSSSISNVCWNAEDVALLLARAVMQDILPRKMPQNIPLLLEYIKECLEILKKEAKNTHVRVLMATAMMDTLGGYLESYGLPIIKRIYYEGNVDYDTVDEFYHLQNEFKMILVTDGGGWSKPMTINHKFTSVIPLKLPKAKEDSCKKIITTSDYNNYNKDISQSAYNGNQFLIPMPMFDDYENPHAIGVPIRGKRLYSLDSRSAFDVLLIYYTQCIQCLENLSNKRLRSTDKTNNPINYFEYHYFNWLVKNVLPRLSDEKWYPGFSNVLRILATIKEKGIPVDNEMKFKFLRHLKHTEPLILEDEIPEKLKRDHFVKKKRRLGLWLSPIALLAFLLSITCGCYLFIKRYCKSEKNREKSRNDKTSSLSDSSTSYPETFSSCGIKQLVQQ